MESLKEMPVSHIQDFQTMFNAHFKPPIYKEKTRAVEEQKDKKEAEDEEE